MRNLLAVGLGIGLVALVASCYNAKTRTDELVQYKIEDYQEKNGKAPTVEEIAVFQTEAAEQERLESIERRKQALEEGAQGVGALASGNLIGGGLLIGGAILTFFGLRGTKTGKPVKA